MRAPARPEDIAAFAEMEPWGYGSRTETVLILYGIDVIVPLVAIGIFVLRWLAARSELARATREVKTAVEDEGPIVVRGVVREVEGGGAAVRVTIDQDGEESPQSGAAWQTTWTEVDRRVECQPFVLELSDGTRLRVEPEGRTTRLVDDLGSFQRTSPTRRSATATLDVGEEVSVSGELVRAQVTRSGGYRGAEERVLRPRADRGMFLSIHRLDAAPRAAARRAAISAAGVLAATIGVHLCALPFHLDAFYGEAREGVVESTWVDQRPRSKGEDQSEYFVSFRVPPDDQLHEERVSAEEHAQMTRGRTIPVRVGPMQTTIGPHPTLHVALALPQVIAICIISVALLLSTPRRRWYEGPTGEKRRGRLSE